MSARDVGGTDWRKGEDVMELTVLINEDRAPGFMVDVAAVRQDDHKAGALIAERVIARGACRPALLTPSQQWPAMIDREAGIRSAIEA
jgi:DNA-binding LacI/PurR family transcriptional regulator